MKIILQNESFPLQTNNIKLRNYNIVKCEILIFLIGTCSYFYLQQ